MHALTVCIFASFVFSSVHCVSEPDYSNAKEPYLTLEVTRLEPKRKERIYGDEVLPEGPGFIELLCEVPIDSIVSSLGQDSFGVRGLKWILPNERMIQENRGFIKIENDSKIMRILLAVTNFKKEDSGEYGCQLDFQDNSMDRYRKSIYIPSLDGSPILSCDLSCERNSNDDCQLLAYFLVSCKAYAFPEANILSKFSQCDTEETCKKMTPFGSFKEIFGYTRKSNEIYQKTEKVIANGLLTKPGKYYCEAENEKGNAKSSIYVSASVGDRKGNALRSTKERVAITVRNENGQIVEQGVREPRKENSLEFIGTLWPLSHKIGEPVTMACWTNQKVHDIRWFFRSAENPNLMVELENGTLKETTMSSYQSTNGLVSQYFIDRLSMDHGGFYECGATNVDDGTYVAKEFAVDTFKWAEDADMNRKIEVIKRTGENVNMKCTVISTDLPQIQWYKKNKDGHIETLEESDPRYLFGENNQILSMGPLRPEDTGLYICLVAAPHSLGVDDLQGLMAIKVSDAAIPESSRHTETLIQTISGLDALQRKLSEVVDNMASYGNQVHT